MTYDVVVPEKQFGSSKTKVVEVIADEFSITRSSSSGNYIDGVLFYTVDSDEKQHCVAFFHTFVSINTKKGK